MRSHVEAYDRQVAEHLKNEFGEVYGWSGIMIPPPGVLIEVVELLQTCHSTSGSGLDYKNGNSIPQGIYEVGRLTVGFSSFWSSLQSLQGRENTIRFCAGYGDRITIDWRGAKKFVPSAEDAVQ